MLQGVVQCLLESQKEIVANLGRQRIVGKVARNLQLGFDSSVLQVFGGVVSEIGGEVFEGVVVRVYRPNNFIQRLQQVPGGVSDRVEFASDAVLDLLQSLDE